MTQDPEPRPDPTAARLEYLARVLANPPAPRQPCAADCGQPLTQWHVDAEGRHWHPDCLPPGTPMPLTRSDREWQTLLAEARATNQRLNKRAQDAESRLATFERAVSEWQLTDKTTYVPLRTITAIAKAAGRAVDPDRYEMHYQRVERAEAALDLATEFRIPCPRAADPGRPEGAPILQPEPLLVQKIQPHWADRFTDGWRIFNPNLEPGDHVWTGDGWTYCGRLHMGVIYQWTRDQAIAEAQRLAVEETRRYETWLNDMRANRGDR